jgi:hypothetical protein
VLCDPRLQTKTYGRIFLSSLPSMPRTSDISDVKLFFEVEHRLTGADLAEEPGAPDTEYW